MHLTVSVLLPKLVSSHFSHFMYGLPVPLRRDSMELIMSLSHDFGHSPLRNFGSDHRPLRRYIGKPGQLSAFWSTVIESSFLCLAGLQL
jgi:hypothetical protein